MTERSQNIPIDSTSAELNGNEGVTELFGIGDLAQEFGITTRAIRFYESKGLLSPKRVNGARVYSRKDRARLILILRGKAIGSSLEEIKHFLALYGERGEGRRPQLEYLVERTNSVLSELKERQEHLNATISELEAIRDESLEHLDKMRLL